MRIYRSLLTFSIPVLLAACSSPASQPPADHQPAAAAQLHGNLLQVMRGILYPSSNILFAVQGKDADEIQKASKVEQSTATDPLVSTYGGWLAVENAGIALAESANLLIIPGRKCANGRLAPIDAAEWKQGVEELRAAGMKTYEAGKSKNEDQILDASDAVAGACATCHDRYRDKPTDEERCM